MSEKRALSKSDTELSRFLSLVLRHKPETIGLRLDAEGWADIAELLRLAAGHVRELTPERLAFIVEHNDKKRFSVSDDGLRIRAAQGHSCDRVDIGFAPRTPPDILYHGTAGRFLESIRREGLLPGSRQYVHLSLEHGTAVNVGARHGKPVVLRVRAAEMARDGLVFHVSENGVWLTKAVPARYLDFPPEPAHNS